jgi:hypothetical protein
LFSAETICSCRKGSSTPEKISTLNDFYLVRQYGSAILGFQPRPSFVLYSLSQDKYQAAFADFQQQRGEEIKQTVFDEFPSPIVHYFYRFENGYENELQRLYLLRDTWEAIVDILHAATVAECRFRQVPLTDPVSFSQLFSDSVAQRLLNIERIADHANKQGIALGILQTVKIATLEAMRELNQSRNGFSHSAAQSEVQARAWISQCYEDVIDILRRPARSGRHEYLSIRRANRR